MFQWNEINLGVCYYPEHWPETLWREDLRRMKMAGLKTVRIAEFAWTIFEPEEEKYEFDLFDRFLELAKEEEMSVIFGTPTATPPAWLTDRYPEVLNCDINRVSYHHGSRRHYNYNSTIYRNFCSRITEQLAMHYGKHPSIIGWQIDNELNCEENYFYSESDSREFRKFLQEMYQTLEDLNRAWGTVFWNQTYTDWEQIYVPRHTIGDTVNPHLYLDYIRFISDSTRSFCQLQADILRRYVSPEVFITTNGLFDHIDNHRMTEQSLDVYTYDSYPEIAYNPMESLKNPGDLKDRKWSRNLSEVRSICPHFGIMEQQSGSAGWVNRLQTPAPKPGQIFLWTMQSIAHGADYVSFFRWRTSPVGTEIYWRGILDQDNRETRKYNEIREIAKRIEKIRDMAGADFLAGAAVLQDYSNIWDAEKDVLRSLQRKVSRDGLFAASQKLHAPMDILYFPEPDSRYEYAASERSRDEFLKKMEEYPVLFYPHPAIISPENAELLENYVNAGGTLVLGVGTGYKDVNGKCIMKPMPGLLREIAGAEVEEGTLLHPDENSAVIRIRESGKEIPTRIYNEVLCPDEDTEVLGVFRGDYYGGTPALTMHSYGRGRVLCFGSTFGREAAEEIFRILKLEEPWKEWIRVPEGCELCVREKEQKRCFIVLNYSSEEAEIELHRKMTDADTDVRMLGKITLKPYGTKVYYCSASSENVTVPRS